MAADDKERARQLRAEARRRRRDEALRRYRERTASSEPSPGASGKRRRAAVEADEEAPREVDPSADEEATPAPGMRRREADESTENESPGGAERDAAEAEAAKREARESAEREEREAAEREARESEEREAAEREARESAEREEREHRKPLTAAEIAGSASAADAEESPGELPNPDGEPEPQQVEASPEEAGEEPTVSMTEGLPAAPRDLAPRGIAAVASADAASDVPAPASPRRSMGVRALRALGTLAVALGSIASLLLALGALTLALGEKPAGLFDALEPVCRTLAFGTGDDTAAVDLLVTWIIAGLAYLVIGFAVQSFTRRVTRRRSRG